MSEQQTEDRQSFRAQYSIPSYKMPSVEVLIEETNYYFDISHPTALGSVVRVPRDREMGEVLKRLDITFIETQEVVKVSRRRDREDYLKELQGLVKTLNTEEHGLCSWNYYNTFTVETYRSLGEGAHKTRRRMLERFLKKWKVEFKVECMAVFSENVCKLADDEKQEDPSTCGCGPTYTCDKHESSKSKDLDFIDECVHGVSMETECVECLEAR